MKVSVSVEAEIAAVLNKFDFDKVHAVMRDLNWTWSSSFATRVPSKDELREKAAELLQQLDPTSEYCCIQTGGFLASARRGKEIRLAFELTSASAWIPEPKLVKHAEHLQAA